MLPNFLVIGAAKAGSTSLYHYLRSHPQVFMPAEKEPEFFLEPGRWHRGVAWYETLFADAGDALARGEASVRYTSHPFRPHAPERIAATIPDARLIYLVREPVARMVSQWVHNTRIGAEREPLATALRGPRYLLLSSYAYQAERFLRHFPAERLLIVESERLRADRGATLDRVFAFLGVREGHRSPALEVELNSTHALPMPRPRVRRLIRVRGVRRVRAATPAPVGRAVRALTHTSGRTPVLPAALTEELHALLRDDVARLRGYAGPSFGGWGIA
jgi:hypothetical protein